MPADPRVLIAVRQATARDVASLIALAAAESDNAEAMLRRFQADLDGVDRELVLATADGELAGYGRAHRFERGLDVPENVAPDGYYLSGVLVASRWRRRGVGEELTRARLGWVFARAAEAWYFTNARNQASLALHAKLGFVEVTRDFTFPGVSFKGGIGVLARALAMDGSDRLRGNRGTA